MSQTLTSLPTTTSPADAQTSDAHTSTGRSGLSTLRATLRARRAERAAIRQLRRDLATYTNPTDIQDLLAMAEQNDGPEAERMRSVLMENLNAHNRLTPFPHI